MCCCLRSVFLLVVSLDFLMQIRAVLLDLVVGLNQVIG